MFESRDYSLREVIADGVVHAIAIIASIAAASALLTLAALSLTPAMLIALAIYSATLIVMFCCSAAYNIIPHRPWKPLLRRFDQAAIFLKIAGAYTPLTVMIGTMFSHAMLVAVWVAAVAGASLKLVTHMRRDRYSVPLYLLLGWSSVMLIWPIAMTVPAIDVGLIVMGGVLYTAGLYFHTWEELEFQNAIWHGFVLAAAACHFTAFAHASLTVAA